MSQLNQTLEDLWNITNGRIELDIKTTPKTNARNGEMWLILTGQTVRVQIKANNRVYTLQDQEAN